LGSSGDLGRHRRLVPAPAHLGLILLGLLVFGLGVTGFLQIPAHASTSAQGGINVEPAARPWQYVGANPDSWWCPTASQCTTSNPLGRIDTEMALAQQLHVADVRLEIPWFLVEPSKGGYDWSRADYIFNSASAHGIIIQPILVYTPAWDGGYNSFPVAADFQAFVTAFMGRYGSRINAVEMWNEPDGGQSLAANNPAQYCPDHPDSGLQRREEHAPECQRDRRRQHQRLRYLLRVVERRLQRRWGRLL